MNKSRERRPTASHLWKNLPEGQAITGYAIGILCIPGVYGLIPGNIQNASTFDFPVLYRVLTDVRFEQIARGDPAVEPIVVSAAKELADAGVIAVVGACGSLGHYQTAVANAVPVPVFMSILTQVPLILRSLRDDQKLGVIFASTDAFTARVRRECGIDDISRIVPIGLQHSSVLAALMQPGRICDREALGNEIISCIESEIDKSVGALLLQCSDLPPFAPDIQRRFALPVFDMTGLIDWLQASVVRRHFQGLI